MDLKKKIILASRSPRRMHLLRQVGLRFEARDSYVEEVFDHARTPAENVKVLSLLKAVAVAGTQKNAVVVGADTVVVLDHRLFGKPRDEREARRMLAMLSGRTHKVYTGLALVDRPSNIVCTTVECTKVKFRKLSRDEINAYVRSGSPMDKAGAYGIQDDHGAVFVEKIEGCFYNVVGLPLSKFYLMMQEFQRRIQSR